MKGYVKLVDTSGSYLISSQGVAINRKQVKEVEIDEVVSAAIRGGALEKCTKEDFDNAKAEASKSVAEQKEAKQKDYEKVVAKKQKELDELKAKDPKKVKAEKSGDDAKAKAEAEAKQKAADEAAAKAKAKAEADAKAEAAKKAGK